MPVTSVLHYAGLSDQGRQRTNNEDRYFGDPERGLFLVVDGVGGQAAGEQAAATAVTLIRERLERKVGSVPDRIREAIAVANNEIYEQAQQNPEWRGMACVLTVAVVCDGQVTVGHVGDSRLYLLEPGQITKITHDHSPVGEREDRGELSEYEAMRHPRRNEVFRDVGSEEHTPADADFIEVVQFALPTRAALLFCSDGLSDQVTKEAIREAVERHAGAPDLAVRELVDAANAAGGKDNVTVLVVTTPEYAVAFAPRGATAAHAPYRPAVPYSETPTPRRSAWWWSLPILGALAAGAAGGWYLHQPEKPVPVPGPAVLRVGAGQALPTIGEALAKAKAGDTVRVAAGTYRGPVAMVEGVTVESEKPQQAVLVPAGPGAVVTAEDLHHARFSGFKITDESGQPLDIGVLLKNADVDVVDVEVTHAREAAVEITGNSKALLRADRLQQNAGSGVIVKDTAEPVLSHNWIRENGRWKGHLRPGVEIQGLAKPTLTGNSFIDNGAEAIWKGAWGDNARLAQQNYFGSDEKAPLTRKIRTATP